MDILSAAWEFYVGLTHQIPVSVFSFLIRAQLILLCPVAVAFAGFSQGLRNQKLQIILMVIGFLAGLSLPLGRLFIPYGLRPWVTILLVLGLWFAPVPFSFLVHPGKGLQAKVLKITRIALMLLFILNWIIWR